MPRVLAVGALVLGGLVGLPELPQYLLGVDGVDRLEIFGVAQIAVVPGVCRTAVHTGEQEWVHADALGSRAEARPVQAGSAEGAWVRGPGHRRLGRGPERT